ncbi:hypothetical protein NDU88_001981 [Pleurodeles waltl]|uniref:Uncharacterized protein n=1 Tax=Pleurodeles waltl TaxID=8319 RepID=A0AAV7WNB5_PLEWA|nr:hypothetical protein NDU88_001981 [Pleurodeles waltl]
MSPGSCIKRLQLRSVGFDTRYRVLAKRRYGLLKNRDWGCVVLYFVYVMEPGCLPATRGEGSERRRKAVARGESWMAAGRGR